ncbi:MAG: histidine phosphatase family protein [Atopobiaceae bacterium]|nr:histidine phosphatase family protein [Atopobiaceae bacterium]
MKRTLYLMRHGETQFNYYGKAQGWCDSPLTDYGIDQARKAAAYFKENGIVFDGWICSTAERACDTLEVMMLEQNGEVVPYERMKGLMELFYGKFEAVPVDMLGTFLAMDDATRKGCGGETRDELNSRVWNALSDYMARTEAERTLAVSHMLVSMSFLEQVLGNEIPAEERSAFNNCAALVFEYDADDAVFTYKGTIRTNDDPIFRGR